VALKEHLRLAPEAKAVRLSKVEDLPLRLKTVSITLLLKLKL
jgi:hypothetical protein